MGTPSAFQISGLPQVGPWNLITSSTASGSTVSFTAASITSYNQIWFTFSALATATTADYFTFAASTNGGSTYAVTFYYYFANAVPVSSVATGATVQIASGLSGAAISTTGSVYIVNPNITSIKSFNSFSYNASSTTASQISNGCTASVAQLNAFQFGLGSGSFSGGTINMYGQQEYL